MLERYIYRKGERTEKPAVPPLGLLSGHVLQSCYKGSESFTKYKIMETKKSIFDIVFTVVMCALWLTLGIVWVSSLNPASLCYWAACFCAACIFFLPVAIIAMVAIMDYADSRKK